MYCYVFERVTRDNVMQLKFVQQQPAPRKSLKAVFTLSYMYGVHVRRTCAMNVYTVAHVRRACATNRYTSHMHDVHVRRTCMIV